MRETDFLLEAIKQLERLEYATENSNVDGRLLNNCVGEMKSAEKMMGRYLVVPNNISMEWVNEESENIFKRLITWIKKMWSSLFGTSGKGDGKLEKMVKEAKKIKDALDDTLTDYRDLTKDEKTIPDLTEEELKQRTLHVMLKASGETTLDGLGKFLNDIKGAELFTHIRDISNNADFENLDIEPKFSLGFKGIGKIKDNNFKTYNDIKIPFAFDSEKVRVIGIGKENDRAIVSTGEVKIKVSKDLIKGLDLGFESLHDLAESIYSTSFINFDNFEGLRNDIEEALEEAENKSKGGKVSRLSNLAKVTKLVTTENLETKKRLLKDIGVIINRRMAEYKKVVITEESADERKALLKQLGL